MTSTNRDTRALQAPPILTALMLVMGARGRLSNEPSASGAASHAEASQTTSAATTTASTEAPTDDVIRAHASQAY